MMTCWFKLLFCRGRQPGLPADSDRVYCSTLSLTRTLAQLPWLCASDLRLPVQSDARTSAALGRAPRAAAAAPFKLSSILVAAGAGFSSRRESRHQRPRAAGNLGPAASCDAPQTGHGAGGQHGGALAPPAGRHFPGRIF
jgi:hypothetical protein